MAEEEGRKDGGRGRYPVRRKKSRRAGLPLALDDHLGILSGPLTLDLAAFMCAVDSDGNRHRVYKNVESGTKSLVWTKTSDATPTFLDAWAACSRSKRRKVRGSWRAEEAATYLNSNRSMPQSRASCIQGNLRSGINAFLLASISPVPSYTFIAIQSARCSYHSYSQKSLCAPVPVVCLFSVPR